MANSLCFTPLASLNSFNKPGLINGNGNCAGRKIQLIKDVTFNSKSNLRVVEVKVQWRAHNVKALGLTPSIISTGGLKPADYVGCAGDSLYTADMAYASVASLLNIQLLLTSDSQMHSQICDRREEFHSLREKKKKARERLCDSLKQVAEEIDRIQEESAQYKATQSSEEYFVQASSSAKVILNDEQCLHVLGLSYNHLTSDLKACLLYFEFFPEDSEVSVKRLVRLWIAEGFLKLEGDLEEEAKNRLQDLVDRCLVLVSQRSADGRKIKTCRIHDLVHELCLREAQSQNFFFIRNDKTESVPRVGSRWISIQKSRKTGVEFQDEHWFRSLTHKLCWLIRMPTDDDNSPLRRIRSIFLFAAPSLNPPSSSIDGERNLFWPNTESVSGLIPYCCTKKILSRFQNIKKLCIRGDVYDYRVHEEDKNLRHLVDLHQLETLSIKVDWFGVNCSDLRFQRSPVYVPSAEHFPTKLNKLKLVGTRLAWADLNTLSVLTLRF
ncbi:hypothetical protein RDI58_029773 [Solanum bulbocastanum]|uniref:Disease resistance protein winged helix domain-containing protein n=1 Tax=Solanum bulbocastanum TaxID=147425 RepID=A0AAN8Y093_SOLBU